MGSVDKDTLERINGNNYLLVFSYSVFTRHLVLLEFHLIKSIGLD